MKNMKLLLVSMLAAVFSGCMDNHDDPTGYTYGNPAIGEANTTIANLKTRYKDVVSQNGLEEVQEDVVISGVIVGDDESGNIYKNIYVNDGSGTMVVGINASGLYASCPVGQKIAIDCKGLYVGGYGGMSQLGTLYQGKIGRMPETTWKEHVKMIGVPETAYPELVPVKIDENWLKAANKDDAPFFVEIQEATIVEADGTLAFAPEAEGDAGNGVNRNLKLGNTTLPFRISTYSNFSTEAMPTGKLSLTGVLTRYGSGWQFTVRTGRDIKNIAQ